MFECGDTIEIQRNNVRFPPGTTIQVSQGLMIKSEQENTFRDRGYSTLIYGVITDLICSLI